MECSKFYSQQNTTIQYGVHDKHYQMQSDRRYYNVILLVATRDVMGLSGWQPLEQITRKAGKQDSLG